MIVLGAHASPWHTTSRSTGGHVVDDRERILGGEVTVGLIPHRRIGEGIDGTTLRRDGSVARRPRERTGSRRGVVVEVTQADPDHGHRDRRVLMPLARHRVLATPTSRGKHTQASPDRRR